MLNNSGPMAGEEGSSAHEEGDREVLHASPTGPADSPTMPGGDSGSLGAGTPSGRPSALGKKTKIVCTMGPATDDDDVLRNLILSGMNVARFNFSHGSHEYHRKNIERVRKISGELGIPIAILLDTKGPEIRTGLLEDGKPVNLEEGSRVTITTDGATGNAERFSMDCPALPGKVDAGSIILIDDGLIELRVESTTASEIACTVQSGGELGEHKGINVPGVDTGLPAVTDQDRADLIFGCEMGVDGISASFIRDAAAVEEIRHLCSEHGLPHVSIFPKIECALGIRNFDEILAVSDGIMVARGDLGVEIPPEQVPHLQKSMIAKCNEASRPVITATQMLDSMIRNPRPTRAEVTDVANAILDGTDCVMLSGETAAGRYPVQAVRMMAAICRETEARLPERAFYRKRKGLQNVNGAIGLAAVEIAHRVGGKCIVAPTNTGRTPRLISTFRSNLPVVAISANPTTIRRCCWLWGVEAFSGKERTTLNDDIDDALNLVRSLGFADQGDLVVLTAGDPATSPAAAGDTSSTNLVMVAQVH